MKIQAGERSLSPLKTSLQFGSLLTRQILQEIVIWTISLENWKETASLSPNGRLKVYHKTQCCILGFIEYEMNYVQQN